MGEIKCAGPFEMTHKQQRMRSISLDPKKVWREGVRPLAYRKRVIELGRKESIPSETTEGFSCLFSRIAAAGHLRLLNVGHQSALRGKRLGILPSVVQFADLAAKNSKLIGVLRLPPRPDANNETRQHD
jgi:hypothetical protein